MGCSQSKEVTKEVIVTPIVKTQVTAVKETPVEGKEDTLVLLRFILLVETLVLVKCLERNEFKYFIHTLPTKFCSFVHYFS